MTEDLLPRVAGGDPAAVRKSLADQHANGGGLAGPVRTEQTKQFTLVELQVEVVHRAVVPVADQQGVELNHHAV